jgi:HEAT repeat protein
MANRVIMALLVLLIASLGVAGWQVLHSLPRDPIIDGKPLGYWVENYFSGQNAADRALEKVGTNAIPMLAQGMTSSTTALRRSILLALVHLHSGSDLAVPTLTNALSDSSAEIRNVARVGLWVVGGDAKQAQPLLMKMFNDPNPGVRGSAEVALEQITAEAATKAGVK